MDDFELQRTKNYLKSKLQDYLESKGINFRSNFRCLNPNHTDNNPSMSYNATNNTVHCFACNATYDIFDLVGMDYGVANFIDQYNKLKSMYLGANDSSRIKPTFLDASNNYQNLKTTAASFGNNIHNANAINIKDNQNNRAFAPNNFEQNNGFIRSINEQNTTFQDAFSPYNDDNKAFGFNHSAFGSNDNGSTLLQYFNEKHDCVNNTNYFEQRGISKEIVDKFNLGFDDRFLSGVDNNSGQQILWQAVIIPTSDYSYTARNIDKTNEDRIRKRGPSCIFNKKALEQGGQIFITEGEFDALSLETLGYKAIALGSVSNARQLLDAINMSPRRDYTFYIALDNDQAGNQASVFLAQGLNQLRITNKRVNISYPYKDPNEILLKDKELLISRMENLEKILSFKPKFLYSSNQEPNYIYNVNNLIEPTLNNSIYNFNVDLNYINAFISSIIKNCNNKTIIISTDQRWRNISNLIQKQAQQNLSYGYLKDKYLDTGLINIEDKEALNEAIEAFNIQCLGYCIFIYDLSIFGKDKIYDHIKELNLLSKQLNNPILTISTNTQSDIIKPYCLQNIDATSTDGIKFKCKTTDSTENLVFFDI